MWKTTLQLLLLQLCSTSFGLGNEQRVVVTEGRDAVLPCSLKDTPLNYLLFDWKKDGQQEVFLYDAGIHYNNGRGGQDPQFKGRVSHFHHELKYGNASIKIRNTKVEDRGVYSCIFPLLMSQIFYIKLLVEQRVVVTEGSDAVLPCSFKDTPLNYQVFDWKKDGGDQNDQEVFLYDGGIHYNNGRGGQDPQFKGRVSHFEDELKHGNASIKIRDTKVEDSGDYSCIFPNLQSQIFHIKLHVAAPKPHITILNVTEEGVCLQCHVPSASPKPTVKWQDGDGNILNVEEPQVSEVNGCFSVTLVTTVTSSGRFRCVVTQEEIQHQVYSETYIYIKGELNWSSGSTVMVTALIVLLVILVGVLLIYCLTTGKDAFSKLRTSEEPSNIAMDSCEQHDKDI